MLQNTHSVCVF